MDYAAAEREVDADQLGEFAGTLRLRAQRKRRPIEANEVVGGIEG